MTELKPCPFCGEIPELVADGEYVICRGCGCFPNICISVERWNTRKGEPGRCCGNCKHMSEGVSDEYDGKYFCEKHTEETGHPEEIDPTVCFSYDYHCWEAK